MSSDGRCSVELLLTEQDYLEFAEFTWTKSRFHRRRFIRHRIVSFFWPVLGVALGSMAYGARYPALMAALALLLGLIWVGVGPRIYLARIRRTHRREVRTGTFAAYFKPSRIEISPEGITSIGATGTAVLKWSSIVDIAATANAAYAYITSLQAYIVPRRAFPDAAAFAGFVEMLRRYREQFATTTAA